MDALAKNLKKFIVKYLRLKHTRIGVLASQKIYLF